MQVYPVCTLQLVHPGEKLLPVSQVSVPTMIPSPQLVTHCPLLLGVYPFVLQAVQRVAEEHVLHDPGQATHPLVRSKYCPFEQLRGLRTSCSHVP